MSGTKIKSLFGSQKDAVSSTSETPAPSSEAGTLAGDAPAPFKEEGEEKGGTVEKRLSSMEEGADPEAKEIQAFPSGIKLQLICVSLLCVNFLVALDQTIVAAAVPVIANDFKALSDVGWYGSAYLLTGTALQPLFGKAFAYFNKRWLFIGCVITFEVGSLICALAQSSKTFIVGRAIAGCGFGGLYIGVLAITATALPIAKQGTFTSLIGACYGLGATIGPVIGGTFTSKVSWRWCFWINLPIGGVALAIAVLFLNPPHAPQTLSVKGRLLRMDWLGTGILIGAVTCLLIALQEGGVATPWDAPKSKGLIIGFGLLFLSFFVVQYFMKENASINLRVVRQRSIALGALVNFQIGATYFALLYFVPIYFQAVRGSSPIHSGVQALALIGAAIATVIVAGGTVEASKGVFNPQLLIGLALGAVGSGLLSTMGVNTSLGKWVGFQLLAGCIGASFMMPYMASQIILPAEDRNSGATAVIFGQTLGATVLVSVANAVYQNELLKGIEVIPGLDVAAVLGSGVSSFREIVPEALLPQVIKVAADSVSSVFLGLAVIAAVGFVLALGIEWKSLKDGEEVNLSGGAA